MGKPSTEGATRRRIVSISSYALMGLALVALLPLWVPLAVVVGLVRRKSFVILRLFAFSLFYFNFEMITLVRVGITCLRFASDRERLQARIVVLQGWWAGTVLGVARRLLRLSFVVDGVECATPGPAILLVRHASILDTLLPSVFIQRPSNWRVRYIVKRELLVDPCLDIAGHILPNYFVDRSGDTQQELAAIRELVQDLGTDGVLIFPEGTRFSERKRQRAVERISRDHPWLLPRAEVLEGVLPPKLGGVSALFEALPDTDCVFLAHRGLESFAKVKNLLSGEVVGATVYGLVWRVHAEDIPAERDARIAWLYDQWRRVSDFVCETVN